MTDAAEVHTYIIKFTSGNLVTESMIVQSAKKNDGRLDFIAQKKHDGEVGFHAKDIFKSDKIIQDLFYSGERKPHMWWDEFERKLTDSFNTYDWHEKLSVHSDEQKFRILNRKINA